MINTFSNWFYANLEDIGGLFACGYVICKVPIQNEIIHAFISIFTAVISAFIIHVIKPYFQILINKLKPKAKNVNKRKINK